MEKTENYTLSLGLNYREEIYNTRLGAFFHLLCYKFLYGLNFS